MSVPIKDFPTPLSPPPATDTYRPLHPLALFGPAFGLGSLLVFVFDAPSLLIFLGIPGLLISLFARRQIRKSEGTQAGMGLTTSGIILSLVALLGWTTSYATDYIVVHLESSRFLDRWVEKLKEHRDGEAFLDTQSPRSRTVPFDPNDTDRLRVHVQTGMGSPYDGFRANPYIAMTLRYPKEEVTWTRLGWPERQLDKGTYTVKYRYELRTPELIVPLEISLKAREPGETKRSWRIELDRLQPTGNRVLWDHGENLNRVFFNDAVGQNGVLNKWVRQVVTNEYTEAFNLATTPADRTGIAASTVALLVNPAQSLIPATAVAAAVSTGSTLNPAAEKVLDFLGIYSALHRDRGVQQPSWLLFREKKDGHDWAFDVRCSVSGMALIFEFKTTLHANLRSTPTTWQMSDYKFLSEKKKPPDPFGMGMR